MLQKEGLVAGAACGCFAPAPPGFGALVPLPMLGFCQQTADRGWINALVGARLLPLGTLGCWKFC